jgi:hypothetical protein
MRRGWSREEAMSVPTRRHFITAAGRTQTQAQWARELGIAEASIVARLARGWTNEAAVTRPAQQAPRYLTIGAVTMTMSQWARRSGIKLATLHRRLQAGWSVEDAVAVPTLPLGSNQYTGGTPPQKP